MNTTVKLFPRLHRSYHTRADVEARFTELGFEPGRPDHIGNVSWFIDQKTARRMVCPGCHRRGLIAHPYRNGSRYRVLASCPHCDAAEEI